MTKCSVVLRGDYDKFVCLDDDDDANMVESLGSQIPKKMCEDFPGFSFLMTKICFVLTHMKRYEWAFGKKTLK